MGETTPANDPAAEANIPAYLRAARQLSAELGVPPDELLTNSTTARSSYPTPECLQPEEVADYQAGRPIGADRVDHASSCRFCHPLLEVSAPGRGFRDAFLEEIAHAEAAESQAPLPSIEERSRRSLRWAVPALAAAAAILLATNIWTVAQVGALSSQIAAMHMQAPVMGTASVPGRTTFVDQDAIVQAVAERIEQHMNTQRSADTQAILAAVDKRLDARLTNEVSGKDTNVIADKVAKKLREQQIFTLADQAGTTLPVKYGSQYFPTYLYTGQQPSVKVLDDGTPLLIPAEQPGNFLNYVTPELNGSKLPRIQTTTPKSAGGATDKTPTAQPQ